MKKSYVAPESRLITVSLAENIAYSSGIDEVGGTITIMFTEGFDGCRSRYTDLIDVKTTGTDFMDYYVDLEQLVRDTGIYQAWFDCFRKRSSIL